MKNREIKFRVWDTAFQEMCDVSSIFFPFKTLNGFDIVEGHGISGSPYRDIVVTEANPLLQFADEKYTDGADVYEGDIYQYDYEYDSDYDGDMPIVKRSAGRGHVKSIYDLWQIKRAKAEGGKVRRIGSIYENPELLKQ